MGRQRDISDLGRAGRVTLPSPQVALTKRQEALWAIRTAARSLGVEPDALTVAAYGGLCTADEEARLPSALRVSLFFGGWHRACEHAALLSPDDVVVEKEALAALYGDPHARQRTYGTQRSPRRVRADASITDPSAPHDQAASTTSDAAAMTPAASDTSGM
jgi:hypothetical protein